MPNFTKTKVLKINVNFNGKWENAPITPHDKLCFADKIFSKDIFDKVEKINMGYLTLSIGVHSSKDFSCCFFYPSESLFEIEGILIENVRAYFLENVGSINKINFQSDEIINWSDFVLSEIESREQNKYRLVRCEEVFNPKATIALFNNLRFSNFDLERVQFLLDNGADPNGHFSISSMVDEHKSIMNYATGNVGILDLLIKSGGSLKEQGAFDCPLAYAVKNGRLDAVKCIIENGGDVNETSFLGTPLSYLRYIDDHCKDLSVKKEIYDFLISHGAK